MKQKLFIFLALILMLVILIGLNAASYVQKEKIPDTEAAPNRSTYNVGATGTRAFYDLLAETGYSLKRWQEPFPESGVFDENEFSTFVIVGATRREITDEEITHIMNWVYSGGKLVLFDRDPPSALLDTTSKWLVRADYNESQNTFLVDSSDKNLMTAGTSAAKPVQPTIYTDKVNAVQPSKFASDIKIERMSYAEEQQKKNEISPPPPAATSNTGLETNEEAAEETTTGETDENNDGGDEDYIDYSIVAPVIHFRNNERNIVADFPYGAGKIVLVSDPYIVANGGVGLVDNAQLAVSVVTAGNGIIAFDEYHQGYGMNDNRLFAYFEGTPVFPIILQLLLLIGLIFYSNSRRFARPLPLSDPDRLSKLEYVSAMAQLQERTKAFDLAIENIYTDFCRRVSRFLGVDNHQIKRRDLAEKISERTGEDAGKIENLMFKCRDIMQGEPTNKKEIIKLTNDLHEIEEKLGIKRAKENRGGKQRR